jgi:hypothetical protein
MRTAQTSKLILGPVLVATALLCLVIASRSSVGAELLFQSRLPRPARPTESPHMVKVDTGGRIYCGLSQSSVWLEIPSGFTSDWGAEFHCDLTSSLKAWNGTSGALSDRGYLIGMYPATAPILRPFALVFEIDPARVSSASSARSYDPATRQWRNLITAYNKAQQRLSVQIPRGLVASGYPGYEDRFLVALFTARLTPKPTPTRTPTGTWSQPAATPLPSTIVATAVSGEFGWTPTPTPTRTSVVIVIGTSVTVSSTETQPPERVPTMTAPPSPTQAPTTPSSLPCPASSLLVALSVVLAAGIHRRGGSAS